MSRAFLLFAAIAVVACSKSDAPSADTSAAASAAMPAATPVSYAGNWSFTVMPADRDTVLLTYDVVATAERTGWKMSLPGRPVMEPRVVHMDNDSVVTENGPYESVLQKGVQVTTRTVMRMEGDRMVGTTTAHYQTSGADSVRTLRATGTRK